MTRPDDLATLKGELAALGVDVSADATMTRYTPPKPGELVTVIVLDKVAEVVGVPAYCVHGFVRCLRCVELCYLGSETAKAVATGQAHPMCGTCANTVVPREGYLGPDRHLVDHRRDCSICAGAIDEDGDCVEECDHTAVAQLKHRMEAYE